MELKHCPFCGGEAKAFYDEAGGTFDVQCQKCGALPYLGSRSNRSMRTLDDVISAWNRRAERTCHMDLTETDTYELTYRTWECSECGRSCEEIYGEYEYCPHCGRKVVADGD